MSPHINEQINRLLELLRAAIRPPSGPTRIAVAVVFGALVHVVFAAAVLSMIVAMFYGMTMSLGRVPMPWAILVNLMLLAQFPVVHSLLLSQRGCRLLSRLVPVHGKTLSSTTYAIIASFQLLVLFALWTPSGVVWWKAEGTLFWAITAAYGASWLLLLKASFDAGAEVQSGALGWLSLMANRRPVFPDMPTAGLFRLIRQPIYVAFALTLWTVPIWTPDQLAIAVTYTAYCLMAPKLKERRFAARYGERFEAYRSAVPYVLPRLTGTGSPPHGGDACAHTGTRQNLADAGATISTRPSPVET